jgi:hypothetical protein
MRWQAVGAGGGAAGKTLSSIDWTALATYTQRWARRWTELQDLPSLFEFSHPSWPQELPGTRHLLIV